MSRPTQEPCARSASCMSPTGLSPSLVALPSNIRLYIAFVPSPPDRAPDTTRPFNPTVATLHGLHNSSLGSSPFARRYLGNLFLDFFSSGY